MQNIDTGIKLYFKSIHFDRNYKLCKIKADKVVDEYATFLIEDSFSNSK